MAKLVVDNVVKMEWESSGALYSKGGQSGRTFIIASKEYETEIGTITVFFNTSTAFVWASDAGTEDEDRWNAADLKAWLKENLDGSFPLNYDEYVPIIDAGADGVHDGNIERYHLQAFAEDIWARFEDLQGYAVETTMKMG